MDKLAAKAARIRVQDALDKCRDCPLVTAPGNPDEVHAGCPVYAEIRAAGRDLAKLERHAEPDTGRTLVLTVPEYMRYKSDGRPDDEIAWMKGVSDYTLKEWKKERGISTDHKRRIADIDEDEYRRLKHCGMTDKEIAREKHVSITAIRDWKREHGITAHLTRVIVPDSEVITALKAGHTVGWITYHLNVSKTRSIRIAKENGMTIPGSD